MRKLLAVLASFLALIAMTGGTVAYADGANAVIDMKKSGALAGSMATQLNRATDTRVYSFANGIFSFNNELYSNLPDTKTKQEFMSTSLDYIKKSKLNTMDKNRMYNFVADQDPAVSSVMRNLTTDTQADVSSAISFIKPFSSWFGKLLGILCVLTVLFLTLSEVLNMLYITNPMFRTMMDHGGDGKDALFVSYEAYKSVQDCYNSGKYSNPLVLYLKRRLPVYFFVAIMITYLISGQIFSIMMVFIDAFSEAF